MDNVDIENTFNAALYTIQIGLNSIKNIDNEIKVNEPSLIEKPFSLINTENNILPAEVSVYTGGMFKTINESIIALFNFLRKSNIVNILVDSAYGIILILELNPEEQTPYYSFNGESVYEFVDNNSSKEFNFNGASFPIKNIILKLNFISNSLSSDNVKSLEIYDSNNEVYKLEKFLTNRDEWIEECYAQSLLSLDSSKYFDPVCPFILYAGEIKDSKQDEYEGVKQITPTQNFIISKSIISKIYFMCSDAANRIKTQNNLEIEDDVSASFFNTINQFLKHSDSKIYWEKKLLNSSYYSDTPNARINILYNLFPNKDYNYLKNIQLFTKFIFLKKTIETVYGIPETPSFFSNQINKQCYFGIIAMQFVENSEFSECVEEPLTDINRLIKNVTAEYELARAMSFGFFHNDLHYQNVLFQKNRKFYYKDYDGRSIIIDWGRFELISKDIQNKVVKSINDLLKIFKIINSDLNFTISTNFNCFFNRNLLTPQLQEMYTLYANSRSKFVLDLNKKANQYINFWDKIRITTYNELLSFIKSKSKTFNSLQLKPIETGWLGIPQIISNITSSKIESSNVLETIPTIKGGKYKKFVKKGTKKSKHNTKKNIKNKIIKKKTNKRKRRTNKKF
jgi:hypothetical protein